MRGSLIIASAIFILFFAAAFARQIAEIFTVPTTLNSEKKAVSLTREKIKVGEAVFDVDIADSMMSRMRGLSGRASLGENEGMYFIFSTSSRHGFWMKDMNFPIDIIWIQGDTVIGYSDNAKPEPGTSMFALTVYYPPQAVNRVLEVPAGTVAKRGIKIGARVEVVPSE